MTDTINEALTTLIKAKPELLDARALVEAVHQFLYHGGGRDVEMLEVTSEVIPAILEAAREVPELREWAAKLNTLAASMYEPEEAA